MSTRRFRPHPAYTDSGVEWLGEIPAHWEVKRLRFSVELNPPAFEARGLPPATEVSFVPMEAVGEYGGLDLTRTRPLGDVETGYTYFRDGDVVIAKITPCFENGKGAHAAGLANGVAFGTTELHVIRAAPALNDDFLFYLTLGNAFRRLGEAEMYGAGGQKRVPEVFIKNLRHPLPPATEQRAIAAFLDRETAKIDALVAKKKRLIKLLQEKRTALITRAVTKGLDPNAPMKDSGVEWLGEIPAHWDMKPLKHVAMFVNGCAFKPDEWGNEGTPIIRIENLNEGDNFNYTTRQVSERYHVTHGDLLFGWSGNRGTSFGPFLWSRQGHYYLNQHIFRITNFSVDKHWFYWTLRAVTFYVEKQAHGIIGMVHITRGELGKTVVPIVPAREQQEIATYLDEQSRQIDALLGSVRTGIDRLRELRIALISAAVTGKIDVRDEVA